MEVYCILSDERVFRSKSPDVFSAVLQWVGIKGVYVPFKVAPADLGQALNSLRILNIAGANITSPYKEAVVPYLDTLSEGANIIGSVNTVVRNGTNLKGYNTNAVGFMDALNNSGFDSEGKSVLVFGTGGAAKAVVFIFSWLRTRSILVTGRNEEKAREIVTRFSGEARTLPQLLEEPLTVDIIVNATSVSNAEEAPQLAEVVQNLEVRGCELVFDLNYERPNNFWEGLARRINARFMDGLAPLAYQARRTFNLWTGLQVPPEQFLKALNSEPAKGP